MAVGKEMLRWARERSGKDIAKLRQRFPKLDLWEEEKVRPTVRQLEDFARATYTPFGYFFLSEPPEEELPIPQFRTIATAAPPTPSPNLLDTIETMQWRQAWLRDNLTSLGEPPLDFVGSSTAADEASTVAERIRERLGLAPDWARRLSTWTVALRHLREAMDAAGIVVAVNGVVGYNTHRKLDPDEFRGFVLVDEYAPLVFVNGADAKGAQMFTLAHELAHLWLGQSAVFDLKRLQPAENQAEIACNAVAAEFLVPAEELQALWPQASQEAKPFSLLARRFKVSAIVTARRALDLGLIGKAQFFDFYNQHIEETKQALQGDDDGGNFYATLNTRLGHRFAVAVVSATREGRLAYRDAYALTGLKGGTFEKYAAELGMGRK